MQFSVVVLLRFRHAPRCASPIARVRLFVEGGPELRDDLVRGARCQAEGLPAGLACHQVDPEGEPNPLALLMTLCFANDGQVLASKAEREVMCALRVVFELRRSTGDLFLKRLVKACFWVIRVAHVVCALVWICRVRLYQGADARWR